MTIKETPFIEALTQYSELNSAFYIGKKPDDMQWIQIFLKELNKAIDETPPTSPIVKLTILENPNTTLSITRELAYKYLSECEGSFQGD